MKELDDATVVNQHLSKGWEVLKISEKTTLIENGKNSISKTTFTYLVGLSKKK